MSNIYCGVGKPKGNQKIGTKEECIKKNQIRLYGLKKITLEDIEDVKSNKKSSSKSSSNSSSKSSSNSSSKKTINKKFEINKENDKKYSVLEIKKIKFGIENNKHQLYLLDKKRNDSKTGKLFKTDEKKYKEHQLWLENANQFIKDALYYHNKKKKSSN